MLGCVLIVFTPPSLPWYTPLPICLTLCILLLKNKNQVQFSLSIDRFWRRECPLSLTSTGCKRLTICWVSLSLASVVFLKICWNSELLLHPCQISFAIVFYFLFILKGCYFTGPLKKRRKKDMCSVPCLTGRFSLNCLFLIPGTCNVYFLMCIWYMCLLVSGVYTGQHQISFPTSLHFYLFIYFWDRLSHWIWNPLICYTGWTMSFWDVLGSFYFILALELQLDYMGAGDLNSCL